MTWKSNLRASKQGLKEKGFNMKLFNWLFTKEQETIQPEPSFESHEVRAKCYNDFIHYMDRHRNEWG